MGVGSFLVVAVDRRRLSSCAATVERRENVVTNLLYRRCDERHAGISPVAGAVNVDLGALRERAWPVAWLALVGTVVSTATVDIISGRVAMGRPPRAARLGVRFRSAR